MHNGEHAHLMLLEAGVRVEVPVLPVLGRRVGCVVKEGRSHCLRSHDGFHCRAADKLCDLVVVWCRLSLVLIKVRI
jgi:hypothetical protein